jgi:hypothetical protein
MSIYKIQCEHITDPNDPGIIHTNIKRRLNWRAIATRAAVTGLFVLGAAALAAELYLLAGLVQTIAGGAS